MPSPKMMRTSWTLRGRLWYILANGLIKKKKKNYDDDNEMRIKEPKGDEYVVSPCLRQKIKNL